MNEFLFIIQHYYVQMFGTDQSVVDGGGGLKGRAQKFV